MIKILVLGHKGYLGSNIVSFLKKKKINTVLYPKKFSFKKNFHLSNVDYIINCIGENYEENKMYNSNYLVVKMIVNKINLLKKKPILIHISSCSVYGALLTINNKIISKSTKTYATSFYSQTKLKADDYIKNFLQNDYYIIRPSQIISNNMKSNNYLNLIYFIKKGIFFYINNKKSRRNYIHLFDVLEFIHLIIKKKVIKNNIYILSRSILLSSIINYVRKSYKLKQLDLVFPKKFVLAVFYIFKIFGFKKSLVNNNSITGLSTNTIIKSNISTIKYYKFKFNIINHYLKDVCK